MEELPELKFDELHNHSNIKTAIILTAFILIFYFVAVFIVTNILDTDDLKHKLIHKNHKIAGSRWVYSE